MKDGQPGTPSNVFHSVTETAPDKWRPIVQNEPWILAWLTPGRDGHQTFTVYVSLLVKTTDAAYAPVNEYLDEHCVNLVDVLRQDDEQMMFGQADQLTYWVHPACPGTAVPHACCLTTAELSS